MASFPDRNLDFEEQRVRIVRAIEEVEKLSAESRKLTAEQLKLAAEQLKLVAEEAKLKTDVRFSPWFILAQGLIGGAAMFGAALALLKYLAG